MPFKLSDGGFKINSDQWMVNYADRCLRDTVIQGPEMIEVISSVYILNNKTERQ